MKSKPSGQSPCPGAAPLSVDAPALPRAPPGWLGSADAPLRSVFSSAGAATSLLTPSRGLCHSPCRQPQYKAFSALHWHPIRCIALPTAYRYTPFVMGWPCRAQGHPTAYFALASVDAALSAGSFATSATCTVVPPTRESGGVRM